MNSKLGTRWVLPLVLAVVIVLGGTGERARSMAPLNAPPIAFGSSHMVGNAPGPVSALAAADVDNDGDLDLVATAGKLRAWENSGAPFSGPWTAREFGSGAGVVTALAVGDVDHDGDLDIVTIGGSISDYYVELWENNGTPFAGNWTPVALGSLEDPIYSVAMGDLDNDGDPDVITGEWDAAVRIWENDGSPFADPWVDCVVGTAPTANEVGALAVGDLDNDGDLDVVSGDWSNQVTAWRNNGDPFARAWDMQTVGTAADEVASLALADLGGDGDLDVVAGYGPAGTSELIAWQNDRTPFAGTWVRQEIGSLGVAAATGVALGDLDVDGDPDLVSGSSVRSEGVEVMSWANDAGTWTGAGIGEMGEDVASLLVADLDQDGDPDVVAAGSAIVAWPNEHMPQALGGWVEGVQPLPADPALSVAAADVNHDGALDLAVGTQDAGLLAWLGDGGYTWARMGASDLPDSGSWPAVAWGQIDNRAELDLAAAGEGLMAWVVEEGGTLWTKANEGLPEGGAYQDVVLAHVDHDGRIDLVACGLGGIEVYAGDRDGSGLPVWQHMVTLGDPTNMLWDVAVGDVNHDGSLDIAGVYDEDTTVGVWLGGGDMSFEEPLALPGPADYYRAVALGDLDHDGDDDLVASLASGGVRVWMVDSEPFWTETATIGAPIKVTSLDLGDVDHDGDLDILAGVDGGVHVWLGDGGASWTAASSGLPTTGGFFRVALGRVDGDAYLDIVAADWTGGGARIWTAAEPPPGGWRSFAPETHPPYAWVSAQQVTASVEVADVGSGLDVGSAEYCYSTDGSSCAGGPWHPASCTGTDGTTNYETITAVDVPFNHDSADRNVIQFRIADLGGQVATSLMYYVAIDATPPTNPADLASTSHTVGDDEWSDESRIHFAWTDAGSDATSGVDGYSYVLTQNAEDQPDEVQDRDAGPAAIYEDVSLDGEWYLHLMTVDYAGNWSEPVHLGPYRIDTQPPPAPTLDWSDPAPGVWSMNEYITVDWDCSDGTGSGIAGYSYAWSQVATSSVDNSIETQSRVVRRPSPSPDGAWYFHVRAIDNAGNAGGIAHFGPFLLDRIPPGGAEAPWSCWMNAPRFSNNETCLVEWEYLDTMSGVASYDVEVDPPGAMGYVPWLTETTSSFALYDQGTSNGTYAFQVRARDQAGNVSDYRCSDETIMEDLTARHLEVTQGIQNLKNEMVLVRGKTTYVRLYARSWQENVPFVDAQLHGTRDGVTLPGSPLQPLRGRIMVKATGGDRGNLDDAFTFLLPSEWRSGTVELTGILDPGDEYPETTSSGNELVETVTFEQGGYFCMVFVPVHLHPETYDMGERSFWPIVNLFKWMYPVANRSVGIHPSGIMYPDGHSSGWEYGIGQDFDVILLDLVGEAFWRVDPCDETHYYGMVHPEAYSRGPSGMGYQPGHMAAGLMEEAGGSRWPQPVGGRTLAHELGHNFGRRHVWCTGCEKDRDRGYPYEEETPHICDDDTTPYTCHIYRPAWNHDETDAYYGLLAPPGGPLTVVEPEGTGDLMSYARRRWPSDWTYRILFNKIRTLSGMSELSQAGTLSQVDAVLAADATVQVGALSPTWADAGEYLFATGIISPTGQTAQFGRFYVTSEPDRKFVERSYQQELADLADEEAYSLLLEDAEGNVLYEHTFTTVATTDEADPEPTLVFAEVFPYIPAERVVLRQGEIELASRPVSANAPTVTVLSPNGGETVDDPLTITWTASDADGDELRYTVQYSPDDGETWQPVAVNWDATSIGVSGSELLAYPGSTQARVRVIATDGVNTGQDESDAPFTLARRPPQAFILEPATMGQHDPGSTVVLVGTALDPEDGMLDEGDAITWRSSLSGVLGSGAELWVSDLPVGAHRIVMTATDSDGQTDSDEIIILVGDVPPWTLDIDPDTMNLQAKLKWVTAYIELGEGYDVSAIDVDTVRLEGTIPAERHPATVADYDGDGIADVMVKFSWRDVVQYLEGTLGEVQLTVSGQLSDGTEGFQVSDTVIVIDEGKE